MPTQGFQSTPEREYNNACQLYLSCLLTRIIVAFIFLFAARSGIGAEVDAALSVENRTYLFSGRNYGRYISTGSGYELDGSIRSLPGEWLDLPDEYKDGIDAAFYYPPTKRIYMFKNGTYIRIKGSAVEEGYRKPKKLPGGWKGLPESFRDGIDAAVFRGGHSYFFKDNRYVRFTRYQIDRGYRKPRKLPGGWQLERFKAGVDAATMEVDSKKGFFFAGDEYVRLRDTRLYGRNSYAKTANGWKGSRALGSGIYSRIEQESRYINLTDTKRISVSPNSKTRIRSDEVFKRYSMELGINNDDRMVEQSRRLGAAGTIYIRFSKSHKGIPVIGGDFIIAERDQSVTTILGQITESSGVSILPELSKAQVLSSVLDESGVTVYDWDTPGADKVMPTPELVLLGIDKDGQPSDLRLAYRLVVQSVKPRASETVFVDANTGEIIFRASNIMHSSVIGEGDTIFYGRKKFRTELFTSNGQTQYRLRAPSMNNHLQIATSYLKHEGISKVANTIDIVSDTPEFNSIPLQVDNDLDLIFSPIFLATTAHWGTQEVEQYWNKFVPFMPFAKLEVLVSEIADLCPVGGLACYDANKNRINLLVKSSFGVKATKLSTISHEFTHALYSHLVSKFGSGESAVINEGLADLFGWLVHGEPNTPYCNGYIPDYFIEHVNPLRSSFDDRDCNSTNTVCTLRVESSCKLNMSEPYLNSTKQPILYKGKHYMDTSGQCNVATNDYCHHNASLVPYWFYLLYIGGEGTNELGNSYKLNGIGLDDAEKIIAEALLYMMAGPMDFKALREATIRSASNLFGENSKQAVEVRKAWYALGVGDNHDTRSYSPSTLLDKREIDPWPAHLSWEQLDNEVDWDVQVSEIPFNDINPPNDRTQIISLKRTSSVIKNVGISERKIWAGTTVNLNPDSVYYWRVRAKLMSLDPLMPPESWGEWGATQSFKTKKKEPAIVSPVSREMVYPWKAKFNWKSLSGASRYHLLVSESSDVDCKNMSPDNTPGSGVFKVVPSGLGSTDEVHEINLKPGKTYYWWLRVIGPDSIVGGCADGGKPTEFTTEKPSTKLLLPPDKTRVSPFLIPLDWKDVRGASGYRLSVREVGGPSLPVKNSNASKFDYSVSKLGSYQWSVIPVGPQQGLGERSASWDFIADLSLTKPVITEPKNGARVEHGETITFRWSEIPGATRYTLAAYHRDENGRPSGEPSILSTDRFGCNRPEDGSNCLIQSLSQHFNGYCVSVTAYGKGNMVGVESNQICYEVAAPRVQLINPIADAQKVDYRSVQFMWSSAHTPKSYLFWLNKDKSSKCERSGVRDVGTDSRYRLTVQPDTKYCWGVINLNKDGSYGGERTARFKTRRKDEVEPNCKPLKPGNFGSTSITYPPMADVRPIRDDPVILKWNVREDGIKQYRIDTVKFLGGIEIDPELMPYKSKVVDTPNGKKGNREQVNMGSFQNGYYGFIISARTHKNCDWQPNVNAISFGVLR